MVHRDGRTVSVMPGITANTVNGTVGRDCIRTKPKRSQKTGSIAGSIAVSVA
jgi:hypothetical protein